MALRMLPYPSIIHKRFHKIFSVKNKKRLDKREKMRYDKQVAAVTHKGAGQATWLWCPGA